MHRSSLLFPRLTALAAALALAYSNDIAALDRRGIGGGAYLREMSVPAEPAHRKMRAPHSAVPSAPNVLRVFNCDDSGSGSLRAAANVAVSGDTIDMTELTCATISLTTGAVILAADDITLVGPGRGQLDVSPSAGLTGRVMEHSGHGMLTISGFDLSSGYYGAAATSSYLRGGCLYSAGSVTLNFAKAVDCKVFDTTLNPFVTAMGGAIYAYGDINLIDSAVSFNHLATSGVVRGGGVYAGGNLSIEGSLVYYNQIQGDVFAVGGGATARGNVVIEKSQIKYNYGGPLAVGASDYSYGGGLFGQGSATITDSIFYRNSAHNVGAISLVGGVAYTAAIINTTISTNSAINLLGGVYSYTPLTLSNSTIAFNTSASIGTGYAVAAGLGVYQTTAELQSSIIAQNYSPGNRQDLSGYGSTITGSANLIMRSLVSPPGTLTDDPLMTHLNYYGGLTYVHALAANSPAIDHGNNNAGLATDQRGAPFVRQYGGGVDIGAYEFQPHSQDLIFRDGFERTMSR
jgi:hypothetical protein